MLFDVRNVNWGKPKADVEVGLDGGALAAAGAGAGGSRAALWLWSRNTVEAGTTRPVMNKMDMRSVWRSNGPGTLTRRGCFSSTQLLSTPPSFQPSIPSKLASFDDDLNLPLKSLKLACFISFFTYFCCFIFLTSWPPIYRAFLPVCHKVLKIMFLEIPPADWLILQQPTAHLACLNILADQNHSRDNL